MSVDAEKTETVIFIVQGLKRLFYAFDRLDETCDEAANGSTVKAFYLDAIYNYVSAFVLLDKGSKAVGGAIPKALERVGLQDALSPIYKILDSSLGSTTFGDTIRIFRNKALVHPQYRDRDLDRIYSLVDMQDPKVQSEFQNKLMQLRDACRQLGLSLATSIDFDPKR